MNVLDIENLKQFINTRLSQSEAYLTAGFDKRFDELSQKIDTLEQKVDDGFSGIGDALEQMNNEADRVHEALNQRLLKLEQAQTA
jgi:hypothetical protein